MATQVEIGQAGERIVAEWLSKKGYHTDIDTRAPGSTDIEARGRTKSLLVQVKAAVQPNKPVSLSSEEERNITSRATRLGYGAYEAEVQIDDKLQLVGEIQWRDLQ